MHDEKIEQRIEQIIERATHYILILNPLALNVCFAAYALLVSYKVNVIPTLLLIFLLGCYFSLKFWESNSSVLMMERKKVRNQKIDDDLFYNEVKKIKKYLDLTIYTAAFGFGAVIIDITFAITK